MSRKSKAAEFVEEAYDIVVTGRNVFVTDAIKDYAIEKVSKIERFSHRIQEVNVTLDIQKLDQRVDLIAKVDNVRLKSTAISTDLYASIDKAVEKLSEQLRRYKSKITDHHRMGHAAIAMNVNVYSPLADAEILELNDDIEAENNQQMVNSFNPHPIVSRETQPLRVLTHKEAIVRMELTGEPFLIFRCEEDRKIKVIHRREDGNFGVITPE